MAFPDGGPPVELGHEALALFQLDSGYRNLNHGAFGTYPLVVRNELRKYMDMCEGCPDQFVNTTFPNVLDKSRQAAAKYLNLPANEVVFVQSVSVAVNTVLRNLIYEPGDVLLYFSTAFVPCENTIRAVLEETPLQARKIDSTFPISHDEIVKRFIDAVESVKSEGLKPRIALFDVISSQPAMRYPFERLVETCREHGILSLVDGAHGIGHIPLDIGKLSPDFFISMTQKWLYNGRGCTVFHVPVRNQHLIRSRIPTSHVFNPRDAVRPQQQASKSTPAQKSTFVMMFEHIPITGNYAFLSVSAALEFRENVLGGEERIFNYIHDIAQRGGDWAAEILGTEVLSDGLPRETSLARRCAMVNVRLPLSVRDASGNRDQQSTIAPENSEWPAITMSDISNLLPWMRAKQLEEYGTHVPIFLHNSALWARLSGQVYLEMDDFAWIADVLKELCGRVGAGEMSEAKHPST